ncbi:MAG TPA: glycosyltransferase [Pirellulales bacterium]|nr:glycosyltransferase [Pirellulales bacterium]
MVDVSLILCARSWQESVDRFLPELLAVVESLEARVELICIEDAACPSAPKALAALEATWPGVRLVSIDPPLGVRASVEAAITASLGETICVLDASGRFAADCLPRLLSRLVRLDAVFGRRERGIVTRVLHSIIAAVRRLATGIDVRDPACLCWAARREAVVGLAGQGGGCRQWPLQIAAAGYRIGQIRVEERLEIAAVDTHLPAVGPTHVATPACTLHEHFAPQLRKAA